MPDYEHYMVQFLRSVCFPQPQPQAPQEQPAQQQRVAAAAPQ